MPLTTTRKRVFQRFDIEAIRGATLAATPDPDEPLDFFPHAVAAGASDEEAAEIDAILTERAMRAAGAI